MGRAQDKAAWARAYISKTYPEYIDAESAYRQAIRELLTPETIAFDAGCGHGGPVQDYRHEIGSVIGADLDLDSLRLNPNLAGRMCVADLDRLPFPGSSFDLITAQWVLEHLSDPQTTFSEFNRILRPGGHFVTVTPNIDNPLMRISSFIPKALKSLLLRLSGRGAGDIFPVYYYANSYASLAKLAQNTGWEIRSISTYGAPFYFIFSKTLFRLSAWWDRRQSQNLDARHKAHLLIVFRKRR